MRLRYTSLRLRLLALVAAPTLLIIGVRSAVSDRVGHRPEAQNPAALTPEQAQSALVALVEQMPKSEQEYFQLEALRAGRSIVVLDPREAEKTWVLRWNCHLTGRNFEFPGPLRPHGCTRSDRGVFERVSGRWQARLVGRSWACSK